MPPRVYAKPTEPAAPLQFTEFPVWILFPYTVLGATLDRPFRRAYISLALGIAEYSVGLVVAASAHFTSVYISSMPVYLLSVLFMFYMDRLLWLGLQIIDRGNKLQDIFLIDPAQYFPILRHIAQRVTALWATISITSVAVPLAWAAVATAYLAPDSRVGSLLRVLEPPTFSPLWFEGPHLFLKMLIVDWFLTIAVLFAVPVVYGSAVIVLSLPTSLPKGKNTWPVIPVPAYVSAKMTLIVNYFNIGALYYAIAVLGLALLYGGRASPQFLAIISVFVLVGLLCVLLPPFFAEYLVDRARRQLADAVASEYRSVIYPVASQSAGKPNGKGILGLTEAKAAQLLRFQELLQKAYVTGGLQRQLASVIPAALSQGLPYAGILLSNVLPHHV